MWLINISVSIHLVSMRNTSLLSVWCLCGTPVAPSGVYVEHQWLPLVSMWNTSGSIWCLCGTPVAPFGVYVEHQWLHLVSMWNTSGSLWFLCGTSIAQSRVYVEYQWLSFQSSPAAQQTAIFRAKTSQATVDATCRLDYSLRLHFVSKW